jgi:hypothetical protein
MSADTLAPPVDEDTLSAESENQILPGRSGEVLEDLPEDPGTPLAEALQALAPAPGCPDPYAYRSGHVAAVLTDASRALLDRSSVERRPATVIPPLGGVVVPVSRDMTKPLPGLQYAGQVALANSCPIIVVVSQAAQIDDFPGELRDRLGHLLVLLHIDDIGSMWKVKLASSRHYLSTLDRCNDVGVKRNFGLQVGVMFGWQSVLFIDDDNSPAHGDVTFDEDGLLNARSLLAENRATMAIGWAAENFSDNSVIGHARRHCGDEQEVFVGGGALLVRCSVDVPFFPDIYNEDWLFLIALALRSSDPARALVSAGRVDQEPYQPFTERRARSEEAGDVIAEALMNRLEDGRGRQLNLTPAEWRAVLKARSKLITDLRRKNLAIAQANPQTSDSRKKAKRIERVLWAAFRASRRLRAEDLHLYVKTWLEDDHVWGHHLRSLPRWAEAADLADDDPLVDRLLTARRAALAVSERPAATDSVKGLQVRPRRSPEIDPYRTSITLRALPRRLPVVVLQCLAVITGLILGGAARGDQTCPEA